MRYLLRIATACLFLSPLSAADIATGPEVGEKIPAIENRDQHGRLQTFESLRGSNGLLLLFHRSADW